MREKCSEDGCEAKKLLSELNMNDDCRQVILSLRYDLFYINFKILGGNEELILIMPFLFEMTEVYFHLSCSS